MDQLNRLPDISDRLLDGLKADDQLKQKILVSAANAPVKKPFRMKTAVALCSLSLLLIILCMFISRFPSWKAAEPEIQNIPAGGKRIVSPLNLKQVIEQAAEILPAEEESNGAD